MDKPQESALAATVRPLVAGNWKMNGLAAQLKELHLIDVGFSERLGLFTDAVICPPATLIMRAHEMLDADGSPVKVGGQDCNIKESGAHTGDISAEMLRDAGASYVIVGHSERRTDHGEGDETVRSKAEAAWRAGLIAIICIGETLSEREEGRTLGILTGQLAGSVPNGATAQNTVIAYEPVWAIGTGRTPTQEDVAAAHAHIRAELKGIAGAEADGVRILYGGSVKPSNALELLSLPNVNGALVGGASLKAADFLAIAESYAGT